MLGVYENFPVDVQKVMRFATTTSCKTLQKAVVQCLGKLNSENLRLEEVTSPSASDCAVAFEFGIADGDTFNYLDAEEAQKVMGEIRKASIRMMDFFCAIRYYKEHGGKRFPLKFDYYMLRLIFNMDLVEVLIFHERGPRHVQPEDLINLIVERVNKFFSKRVLKAV
ncbi:hypothetical protein C0199_00060 [Candidatus Bathyarchaeota archaeon]|nr:MAG: hypothetical protein C0199_00060 [Candidatus Bathyarchaeota archaeon]